ncbi:flavodoxin [Huintestinicola sp.]|uniref:flavodoxin n=1 Tax=Huintestinicola sp. TaxID=2981661 RepID=UPI003D7CBDB9
MDNFITQNDFTGKTVIPFCTSANSGLGQSGELQRDMAGTGNRLEGQRFRENPSEEDMKDRFEGLGL